MVDRLLLGRLYHSGEKSQHAVEQGEKILPEIEEKPANRSSEPESRHVRPAWQSLLLGLAAGGAGALIGVGGGVVMVPILTMWGISQRRAQGSSLVVIAAISPLAIFSYFRLGNIDFGFAVPLAIGGVLGSWIGSNVVQVCPNRLLARIFGAFLILVALTMLFVEFGDRPEEHTLLLWEFVEAGLLGILAGFVAGLFGVGGGVVFVPTGVLLAGLEQVTAQGSSFTAILPTSLRGVRAYQRKKEIEWQMVKWIIPGALLGVIVGAFGADLTSGNYLRYLFACYLLYTGVRRVFAPSDDKVCDTNGRT